MQGMHAVTLLAIGTAGADWHLAGAAGTDNTYRAAVAGIGQAEE
jgi:hypothetical protein